LIAWVLLIGIIAFSVIRTQQTNDHLTDAQASILSSQTCTEQFLGSTVKALNERTQFSTAQANANVDLQQAQLRFITVIVNPGHPDSVGDQALREYFNSLRNFIRITSLNAGKASQFPYPTSDDYRACLANGGK
jgi:hypothetical protein